MNIITPPTQQRFIRSLCIRNRYNMYKNYDMPETMSEYFHLEAGGNWFGDVCVVGLQERNSYAYKYEVYLFSSDKNDQDNYNRFNTWLQARRNLRYRMCKNLSKHKGGTHVLQTHT